jgi:hypothetical protein
VIFVTLVSIRFGVFPLDIVRFANPCGEVTEVRLNTMFGSDSGVKINWGPECRTRSLATVS